MKQKRYKSEGNKKPSLPVHLKKKMVIYVLDEEQFISAKLRMQNREKKNESSNSR